MVEAKLLRALDYPASRVWAVFEDYGNMEWAMGPPNVEVIGSGIGMTRRILMDGMDPIDEVLQMMDPANMTFSYTIPRGLPLPLTDYRSTARVESTGDNSCVVHWSCECTPTDDSMTPADTQALMEATYGGLLDSLEAFLARQ